MSETKLEKLTYRVTIAGQTHEVTVSWADQVLAEREGPRHGLKGKDTPLQVTDFWVWSALKRNGLYPGAFQDFTNDNTREVVPVLQEPVDPTPPAASSDSA